MSNIDDPNYPTRNRNLNRTEDKSYTGWIISGLVALAVILGIVFLLPTNNSNTANNNNNSTTTSTPATSPAPSTTGTGATSPGAAPPRTPPASR